MQIIKEKQDVTLHLQEVRSTQGLGKKHKKAHSSMLWRYQNLLVIICGGLCSPLCSCQHPQASLSLCWAPSSGPYKGIWGREGGRDGVRCFSLPVCSFSDRLTPHSLPCSETLGDGFLLPGLSLHFCKLEMTIALLPFSRHCTHSSMAAVNKDIDPSGRRGHGPCPFSCPQP